MIDLLFAVVTCVVLHVSSAAFLADQLKIRVREVSIGFGPVLARFGRVTLRPFLFGGSVRFKDSEAEYLDPDDMHDAFDAQPLTARLAVGASGCIALVLMAAATLRMDGLRAFVNGFAQIVGVALSPLGEAQELLAQMHLAGTTLPFVSLLGFTAAKFAALNLLPSPATNGGFLIRTAFLRTRLFGLWPSRMTSLCVVAYLGLLLSWLCALLVYLTQSGAIDLHMLNGK